MPKNYFKTYKQKHVEDIENYIKEIILKTRLTRSQIIKFNNGGFTMKEIMNGKWECAKFRPKTFTTKEICNGFWLNSKTKE